MGIFIGGKAHRCQFSGGKFFRGQFSGGQLLRSLHNYINMFNNTVDSCDDDIFKGTVMQII